MAELICHAYDCTIRQYMDIAFMNRRNALTVSGEPTDEEISEALNQIVEEFNECMADPAEFKSTSHFLIQIQRTQQRIRLFENQMTIQRTSLDLFDEPLVEGFATLSNFSMGAKLIWTGDRDAFEKILFKMEAHFRTNYIYLDHDKKLYEKQLEERKKNEKTATQTQQQSFASFVMMLNSLKTHGLSFDKEKDTMIELGFAVQMISTKNKNATE